MGLQLSSLLFDAGEGFFRIQYSIFYFDEIIWFSCFIVVGTDFRGRATQNTLLTLGALLLWDLRSFLIGFLTTFFLDINASIKAIIRAIFEILIFWREMTHGHIKFHKFLFVVFELHSFDIRPVEVLEVFVLLDVRNSIF